MRELKWTSEDDKSRSGWLSFKRPKEFRLGGYETRYIVTGNLLSRVRDGQYVYFTRADGSIEYGKLMPWTYNPSQDENLQYVIMTNDQTEDWLRRSEHKIVINHTQNVTIAKLAGKEGTYTIEVPQAKARGGKFYLDQDLLNLVGTFHSNYARYMVAEFPDSRLKEVLELLRNKFGVTFSLMRKEYDKFFGNQNQGDQPLRVSEEEPLFKTVSLGGVGQRWRRTPRLPKR
jgi:hypothetical protein